MRPTLFLLVGIPGSGKTTYAQNIINASPDPLKIIHLSSDKIRQELYGNEAEQGDPNEIFTIMQERALTFLNDGISVIYDATNITRKNRASIINACPKFVYISCHIVWASVETCIERDSQRNRTVGKDIIDKMLKRFQAPYYDECFDHINIWINDIPKFDTKQYRKNILTEMNISHDNLHHTLSIYDHCEKAMNYAHEHHYNNDIIMAAALHDCGKPYVKAFKDTKNNDTDIAHYYCHENVSAWMSYGATNNIYVAWLISTHMDPYMNTKYYRNLPSFLKDNICKLHAADQFAH